MSFVERIRSVFRFNHPLWAGAFRPLFFLSAVFGMSTLLLWPFMYFKGLGSPGQVNTMSLVESHGYQMLVGFILAALAGFILTAIAEFTDTAFLSKRHAAFLIAAWLIGRIAFYVPSKAGAFFVALTDIIILTILIGFTIRRLNWHYWKRHYDFVMGLTFLFAGVIGYHAAALTGEPLLRYLRVIAGAWVFLIIVAMSRISMRIVNEALESNNSEKKYLARPPRKHLAMLCVALFTAAEFLKQSNAVKAWLALASAAAILNLLNDWHVEWVVFRKRVLSLYTVYGAMASGYALLGLGFLFSWPTTIESAARHFLFIGSMSISVFMVFAIAGRTHSGHELDERAWVPTGILLLVAAMLSRFLYGYFLHPHYFWLSIALWICAFALSLYFMAPIFFHPRPDGKDDASG